MKVSFIERAMLALALSLAVGPAFAQCNPPPPGLTLEQFHVACNAELAGSYYGQGWNQRISPLDYERMMYQRIYGRSPDMAPSPYNGLCSLGQAQCFNGYVRRCEMMANGAATWWVTSGQSCR